MLTFNCSQAAADFFTRVHKGKKISPVEKPSQLQGSCDDLHTDPHQWLVHAATVQRKHVLLAMHLKTRYCMLFFDMKKADDEGFAYAFINRWTAGVLDIALKCDVLDRVEPQIPETLLYSGAQTYPLFLRGDRSTQTHVNEVLRGFKWEAEDFDFVRQPWSALHYDAQTNRILKSIKGQSNYVRPAEEMLIHWMITVGGVDPSLTDDIRKKYRQTLRDEA